MKKFILILSVCMCTLSATAGNKKTLYRNALVLAYSQANSVYEDDNIKLEIYNEELWATNKTTKTIFIDLAQCFLFHNGSSTPMISRDDKKQGDNKASRAGYTSSDDEFFTLPPNMGPKQNDACISRNLATRIYGQYSTTESKSIDFTEYDKRFLNLIELILEESLNRSEKGKNLTGSVRIHLTEDESINNIGASIAYSFNKKSEEWTNVSLTTWVSDVIFAPYYLEIPKDLKKKEKKGFGIKETDPVFIHIRADEPFEFDEEKSPIIVCDWSGDYKKGTFLLTPTLVVNYKKEPKQLAGKKIFKDFIFRSDVEYYKRRYKFDGPEAEWGKLEYDTLNR